MYNETGAEFPPYAMSPVAALWAGVFAVMFCACGSLIALSWTTK
jgi:hypothetical protein